MSNRFEKAFIESVTTAIAFGDVGGAASSWPFNSDFYAPGDSRNILGDKPEVEQPKNKKKKKKKNKKIPLYRRNLPKSL